MAKNMTGSADHKPKTRAGTIRSKVAKGRQRPKKRAGKAEIDIETLTAKVIAMWAAGATHEETAVALSLSKSTVWRIRENSPPELRELLETAKTNEITLLIEENLKSSLLATQRIADVTKDEVWIKAQRAPELATFYGVISDKTVRILAAIERSHEREQFERGPDIQESSPIRETAKQGN